MSGVFTEVGTCSERQEVPRVAFPRQQMAPPLFADARCRDKACFTMVVHSADSAANPVSASVPLSYRAIMQLKPARARQGGDHICGNVLLATKLIPNDQNLSTQLERKGKKRIRYGGHQSTVITAEDIKRFIVGGLSVRL